MPQANLGSTVATTNPVLFTRARPGAPGLPARLRSLPSAAPASNGGPLQQRPLKS
jgi:hypothetical protein